MFNMIMFTVAGAEDARRIYSTQSQMTKKGSIRRWKKKKIIKGKNGKKIRRKKIKTGMLHHKISKQGRLCPDLGQRCPFLLRPRGGAAQTKRG